MILLDISEDILQAARREIGQNVRFQALFGGEALTPQAVLEWITFKTAYEALSDVNFVIENVTEKWQVKQPVFEQLDAVCPAGCILASNTSAIPITRLATLTKRPGEVIGMHFMNPVPLKPTVEVIPGEHTTPETLAAALNLLARMGKEGIIVGDSPGFVSNRVLMLTINEAIFLLQEQVASAEQVDRIFKTCFGHKMGPLETADLIGLDTVLYSIEVLYESFDDRKYSPCPLLRQMVEEGKLGRKSGQGFYAYPASDGSTD